MGLEDQKRFTDAVAKAGAGFWGGTMRMFTDDWKAALHACSRLAMNDMLPALNAINSYERWFLMQSSPRNPRSPIPGRIHPSEDRIGVLGKAAFSRVAFAVFVVEYHEIEDHGLLDTEVNDGREFLGCTRLDDAGVWQRINDALTTARTANPGVPCCKDVAYAWTQVLVPQRRVPNGSLIANLAAAAHYMLARYHVCQAKASRWQMRTVIDGYDANKRIHIATGDRSMRGVALTGNLPFPPDFAIRNWAYRGADDGDAEHLRCNPDASFPLLFPDVNGSEL